MAVVERERDDVQREAKQGCSGISPAKFLEIIIVRINHLENSRPKLIMVTNYSTCVMSYDES